MATPKKPTAAANKTAVAALAKLTSNQGLTDAEKKTLGVGAPAKVPTLASNLQLRLDKLDTAQQNIAAQTAQRKADDAQVAADREALFAPAVDERGAIPIPTGTKTAVDPAAVPKEISPKDRDAFLRLRTIFESYNLGSLANSLTDLMEGGFTPDEAEFKLKFDTGLNPKTNQPWNAAYTKRFAGNAARVTKGLNAYDESTYLEIENSYEETLIKYGLGNMLSVDKTKNQDQFATYIGNIIAPTEFAGRIKSVSEGVIYADPATKSKFQTFFPSLTDTDIISYFLNPKEMLPVLEQKVTAAQIGVVSDAAGYGTSAARAMEFAQFGVTRADALTGYQNIAEVTPTGNKLSNIYNEEKIQYGQTEAENEYLKQDAQAKLKRNRLASKERAMFQADSGASADTFTRQISI